ncbi:MAG: ABC transporter ATP-binding protein [Deltaproteobacteria bacterium]|jgi:peptide/nickel transport system ATP-binding protein|nr:ABC transporter ATP-binding protein [Deltaproteobacteria bacterium]
MEEKIDGNPLLKINGLALGFGSGSYLPVKSLDLELGQGEVAGLVGESGSGKSLTAFALMDILPYGATVRKGEILFQGENILEYSAKKRRELCGKKMGMIFQEPLSALNPVLTIGDQVSEIFRHRLKTGKKEARERALELLSRVGLPNPGSAYESYPHRFSGGMRQRVVIAMALALNPDLVVADEPTTALDPTIALQIIKLLKDLTAGKKTGVLFITHNLRLLEGLAERIFVMYAGLVLEETAGGLKDPLHPYTLGLVKALPPGPSEKTGKTMIPIPGQAPSPGDILPGCPFAPRCLDRFQLCLEELPELHLLSGGRRARCHKYRPC